MSISRTLRDYISIARPDHWFKHVFIIPGIVLGLALNEYPGNQLWFNIVIGFISASLAASANYVINEWLDREFDRYHPLKSERPAAAGRLSLAGILVEYFLLTLVSLWLAYLLPPLFLWATGAFLVSGILYNVAPLRTKERAYLDVLTEAFNNPIRLFLGWAMVCTTTITIPPTSVLFAYWFGGAFLMATKRLAEYRYVAKEYDRETLVNYRRSFSFYDENSLLVSCFMYGLLSSFALAVFLVKYRAEFVFTAPLFAWLFAYYLHIGLLAGSIVQTPEKLYRQKTLWFIVSMIVLAVIVFSFVDIPLAEWIVQSRLSPQVF